MMWPAQGQDVHLSDRLEQHLSNGYKMYQIILERRCSVHRFSKLSASGYAVYQLFLRSVQM